MVLTLSTEVITRRQERRRAKAVIRKRSRRRERFRTYADAQTRRPHAQGTRNAKAHPFSLVQETPSFLA